MGFLLNRFKKGNLTTTKFWKFVRMTILYYRKKIASHRHVAQPTGQAKQIDMVSTSVIFTHWSVCDLFNSQHTAPPQLISPIKQDKQIPPSPSNPLKKTKFKGKTHSWGNTPSLAEHFICTSLLTLKKLHNPGCISYKYTRNLDLKCVLISHHFNGSRHDLRFLSSSLGGDKSPLICPPSRRTEAQTMMLLLQVHRCNISREWSGIDFRLWRTPCLSITP